MTVSGNVARRMPYAPMLAEWGHVVPCFCYHCEFGLECADCGVACAADLDSFLQEDGAQDVAAFIFEPVAGATLGSGASRWIRATHRGNLPARGILLIADEVMSGMGRTGKAFAVQHWGVEPDLILVGKGVGSGYAPLGAVLVSARVRGDVCARVRKHFSTDLRISEPLHVSRMVVDGLNGDVR